MSASGKGRKNAATEKASGKHKKPMSLPIIGPLTRRNLMAWAQLIAIVLIVRWVWFEPYSIPSGSMEPTLHGDERILRGDRVFINKFLFGPRIPFTQKRIWYGPDPKRWDIVVFRSPDPNALYPILIKRVVGLPGERVQVGDDGRININGQPVEPPDEFKSALHYLRHLEPTPDAIRRNILEDAKDDANRMLLNPNHPAAKQAMDDLAKLRERVTGVSVPGLTEAQVLELTKDVAPTTIEVAKEFIKAYWERTKPAQYGVLPDDEYSIVPPGHFLVMGDNSGNSVDGRFFGWLPHENLLGRAFCIWWPLNHMRDLTGFSKTWWGMLIVYVLPVVLIAYIICHKYITRTCRVSHATLSNTFQSGDRLRVNCMSYGLKIPVVGRLIASGRRPQRDDIVLFWVRQDDALDGGYMLGWISGLPGERLPDSTSLIPKGHYLIACDETHGAADTAQCVDVRHIIGNVVSVCWPLARRRSVEKMDSAAAKPGSS